jgi:probable HAF family extracellular repeat protein
MLRSSRLVACLALASATAIASSAAYGQTIIYLPGNVEVVNGCNSKTGNYSVGSYFSGTQLRAYRWSAGTGLQDVGVSAASPTVALFAEPEQGAAVVGYGTVGSNIHAFWWHPQLGIQDLGTFGGSDSTAYCVSAFGEVTVGEAHDGNDQNHAFRFVRGPNAAIEDLGTLGGFTSSAYFVSQNGFTVVGDSQIKDGSTRAFVWNELDGMINCGSFSGGESYCTRCSEDGTAVLGRSRKGDGKFYAFRWTDHEGMRSLGSLGGRRAESEYASVDGSVVTGTAQNKLQQRRAFRWSEKVGMRDLGTLGGAYSFPTGISGDGRLIVGVSEDRAGRRSAFVSGGKKVRSMDEALADVMDPEDIEGVRFVRPRALSRDGRILYVDVSTNGFPATVQLSMPPEQPVIGERPIGAVASNVTNLAYPYAYSAYQADLNNSYAYLAYVYALGAYNFDLKARSVTYEWWEKESAEILYRQWRNAMQLYFYYAAYYAYVDFNYVSGNPYSYYAAVYCYYAYQYGLQDLAE